MRMLYWPLRSPTSASKRFPGRTAKSRSDVAASKRSSFSLADRSKPENGLTRNPLAKSPVFLSRKLTITGPRYRELRVTSSVQVQEPTLPPEEGEDKTPVEALSNDLRWATLADRLRRRSLHMLMQGSGFGFGLLEERDASVGVFPESEEVAVGGLGFGVVAREGVGAGETEAGECADQAVEHDAPVIEDFLELRGGLGSVFRGKIGLAANVD